MTPRGGPACLPGPADLLADITPQHLRHLSGQHDCALILVNKHERFAQCIVLHMQGFVML